MSSFVLLSFFALVDERRARVALHGKRHHHSHFAAIEIFALAFRHTRGIECGIDGEVEVANRHFEPRCCFVASKYEAKEVRVVSP